VCVVVVMAVVVWLVVVMAVVVWRFDGGRLLRGLGLRCFCTSGFVSVFRAE